MAVPNELKYSKEHEWVKVEGNTATIGITEYAQNELGDIVFVELPEVDDEINEGDTFGSVESVKLFLNYMHHFQVKYLAQMMS